MYRLATETGLRRDELKSLKKSSFNFNDCTVMVKARDTKNKKMATLPLRKNTAIELQKFLSGKMPHTKAFKVPVKTASMIKVDLYDAGIPYVDDAGQYGDFHSLRHSTGSLLAASGAHPKVVQSIMRHSDINLTMNRYTHIFRGQESEAIEGLPDLSLPSKGKQKVRATGTDDMIQYKNNFAICLAKSGGKNQNVPDSTGLTNLNNDIKKATIRVKEGNRTPDPWIHNPVL